MLHDARLVTGMDLKQYEQTKFAMAEILRAAQAVDTKDTGLQSSSRDLLARLADDRFNLMVVGRFNRGKSTLVNALLGAAHLPTGILPRTSVITTVRYGSRTQVVLNFAGSRLRQPVPLSRLPEYVTQQSNPGNVKGVECAEIELPAELLRRGLFFVDSPGLGSAIAANTQTTERFFPEADAFVLITSYESPLSEEEVRALRRIREAGKALFIAVNKQDTAGMEERSQVLEYVQIRLSEFSFPQEPKIFSISAREGLEGKLIHNADLEARSGIPQFEEELLRFLTEERAEAFVQNMRRRTEDFLALRRNLETKAEKRAAFESLLERMGEIQAECGQGAAEAQLQTATAPRLQLEFEQRSGCTICGEVLDAVFRFLSKHQYDLTIDREVQREHAARGGFCSLHTWQYENLSSPYGVCAAYPVLAHRIAADLLQAANGMARLDGDGEEVDGLLASPEICRVCQVRIDAEREAVKHAAAKVIQATGSAAGRLPACCLPHLAMTLRTLDRAQPAGLLLQAHSEFLERLAEDAQRYALRHDALRRHLTSEEERRAAQLLLLMLTGHRSLCAPWQVEWIAG